MSNKFARKLAKYLAIILAAAMIAGLFFMFMPSLLAEGETDETLKSKERDEEELNIKEIANKYIYQIEELIRRYKDRPGYHKAVKALKDYMMKIDLNNLKVDELKSLIDNFGIDKSEMKKNPVFVGDSSELFRPADNLNRAEFATIVLRLMKVDFDKSEIWYDAVMKKAKEVGFMKGDEFGNMRPNDNITLGEAITVLARFKNIGEAIGNTVGVPEKHWSRGFMQKAFIEGWLKRLENVKNPDRAIRRDEVAALMTKVRGLKIDKNDIDQNIAIYKTYKDVGKKNPYYYDIIENSN
ncbi:hypothetical protein HMPREF1634_08125 [Tissierellia bacterium S7-1-4]|uniref:S-layer homology domain-containing protein n=1 Tax=Ezakiella coagulans TaxID=46507 RepID=UPI00050F6A51|nr:S-layer homology domain-containing protein [Ezakiella coagulans]KGF06681.1 hypothetical protein HMPREF1634_08125 [Tissierellia bacterium S7-1-4]UQK60122.1 S-layer homology domain-containing protein [Ezakiella coagulans]